MKSARPIEKLLIDDLILDLNKILDKKRTSSIIFDVEEFITRKQTKKYVKQRKNAFEINCSIMITSAICIAIANILKREKFGSNSSCESKLEEVIILFKNGSKYSISTDIIQSVYLSTVDN